MTQSKRVERDLAWLAAIIESSDDAIISMDLDGIITSWNQAAERLFGYSAEEAVGQTVTILLPDDRVGEKPEILRQIAAGERVEHYETVRRCKDGSLLDIFLSVSPIVDSQGQVIGASKISRDITERRIAEARLKESELRYRQLAELLPVALYTCAAPSGIITYFNPQAEELWGRRPEPGDSDERFCGALSLFWPDGTPLPHEQTPMALALRTGKAFYNQDVVIERPDGSRITVLANIDPISDSEGEVIGAINVFHDVSNLKETEQALRNETESLQTLLDTLPIGVVIAHDPQCRTITGNRAATALLHTSSDANLSLSAPAAERPRQFRVYRDGREISPENTPLKRAACGETVRGEALEIEFSDGSKVHSLVSAQPLYHADGRPRGAVGCILDVTELKTAENALRLADRRKDEFLATLSHELRNPLAPIRTGLELLKRIDDDPLQREEVRGMMERQTRLLIALVDDLLDVARITKGKLELRTGIAELSEIVETALEAARPDIDEAGHTLTVDLPEAPVVLQADSNRLSQVLSNLLDNAAKYTPKGGLIRLAAEVQGDEVIITVRDNGIGIPTNRLDQIFHMFEQVQSAQPALDGRCGLGIGLTLVKTIVGMHGGSIEAKSAGEQQGSTFIVRLPCETAHAAAGGNSSKTVDAQQNGCKTAHHRVLVVDDNIEAARMLSLVLSDFGSEVRTATDGEQALVQAKEFRPDVVLMDLGMPKMDGYEAARKLRERPWGRDITLVALSGWGQPEDLERTAQAGFDGHLVKPAEPEELQKLIAERAVERSRSRSRELVQSKSENSLRRFPPDARRQSRAGRRAQ